MICRMFKDCQYDCIVCRPTTALMTVHRFPPCVALIFCVCRPSQILQSCPDIRTKRVASQLLTRSKPNNPSQLTSSSPLVAEVPQVGSKHRLPYSCLQSIPAAGAASRNPVHSTRGGQAACLRCIGVEVVDMLVDSCCSDSTGHGDSMVWQPTRSHSEELAHVGVGGERWSRSRGRRRAGRRR